MNRIEIQNIGPIKNATLDLNKVNVIMGPQSSGKSTIAKIVSYCQWVEKRFILDGEFKEDFMKKLKVFHRLSDTYFNKNSFFSYESDSIKIIYQETNNEKNNYIKIDIKNKGLNFVNSKNIYIPAERNFVAAIPNLGRYKETNDNIMNFLYDWYEVKKKFDKKNALPLLNLGILYYHIEESDTDNLILNNKNKLPLNNASSGLQSATPLLLFLNYLTKGLYTEKNIESVYEKIERNRWYNKRMVLISKFEKEFEKRKVLIENKKENGASNSELTELNEKQLEFANNMLKNIKIDLDKLEVYINKEQLQYQFSQLIIEEPEQNLFPKTQRDLVYYMIQAINENERNHKLLITTHSPFILYALNNCMMGDSVKNAMPLEEQKELSSSKSWINPDLVSVWEIEDGKLRDIKNKETKTVSKHYFNSIMNEVMDEYYDMLNYFES